jgi:hypothetical protein
MVGRKALRKLIMALPAWIAQQKPATKA